MQIDAAAGCQRDVTVLGKRNGQVGIADAAPQGGSL